MTVLCSQCGKSFSRNHLREHFQNKHALAAQNHFELNQGELPATPFSADWEHQLKAKGLYLRDPVEAIPQAFQLFGEGEGPGTPKKRVGKLNDKEASSETVTETESDDPRETHRVSDEVAGDIEMGAELEPVVTESSYCPLQNKTVLEAIKAGRKHTPSISAKPERVRLSRKM